MLEIEQIFIKILNMSLNASFVIIAVLFLRLLFKKLPKKYSYVLWLIVFLRFLWPFTFESMVSLIPITSEPITQERLTDVTAKVRSERPIYSSTVTKQVDTYNTSYNDAQSKVIAPVDVDISSSTNYVDISNTPNYVEVASIIWLGIGLLLITVSVVRLIKLNMKLNTATLINEQYDRVYETDQISSPFIIGIIRPRICLPIGLTYKEMQHVIMHERMHWKRKDYLVKLIAFIAVILHWFNPLAWVSLYLLTKDMEMSCDEMVMEQTKEDIRLDYSQSLLSLSIKQSGLLTPLAFGESNTKSRVKNILNFKKPSSLVSIIAILLVLIIAVTLLTNSKEVNDIDLQANKNEPEISEDIISQYEERNALAVELYQNRTTYIGDNSKVLELIYKLPVPEGLKFKDIELQTTTQPYELHVYYEYDSDNMVDKIDNDIEFKNAMLLFSTVENMGQYTIHRTYDGGESRLSYRRSELVELFGDMYSYSESPEKLIRFMGTVDNYLDGVPLSVEAESYKGRALTIGIIGKVPKIREEQVKFVNLQFSDLEKSKFTQYDAIFITKDNLSEAAQDKYASIYKESMIPFFFIQSNKNYLSFLEENLSYEDAPSLGEFYYATGSLYSMEMGWSFGLYNDVENETNIKSVYSYIFEIIAQIPYSDAFECFKTIDFRKLLAQKLNINDDNKKLTVTEGNTVNNNGITMKVGSTYTNGIMGIALLAFAKDNGEIFYNSMTPDLKNVLLKRNNEKEVQYQIITELSEDSKVLFCYISFASAKGLTNDIISFDIENLSCNQSQVEGVTFKDKIIYGNWSSQMWIVHYDETITATNTTLSEIVSMCGKELQLNSLSLANTVAIINTTVLSDEGLPSGWDALLSSVSTQSGSYYGVYVEVIYEDGTSNKTDCTLDEDGNIIAWFLEPIKMESVKTVVVGDVSIDVK